MNKEQIKRGIERYLKVKYGKSSIKDAKDFEIFNALSLTLLEGIVDDWNHTEELYEKEKNAYYFSAEYLMGRALGNNLISLGLYNEVKEVLDELGFDLNRIEEIEEDAGLGNGGLGRLAACFMDSGASLEVPLKGYGIRYNNGLFSQYFEDGFQKEDVDSWLKYGEPWSIRKEDEFVTVDFEDMTVKAIPYDTPIIGYASKNINTLRLWKCEPVKEFDFKLFNEQKYDEALELKNRAEDISRVLYPNDSNREGKLLRLRQQYFLVSASLKDIIRKHKEVFGNVTEDFAKMHAVQLNDTHPVLAIPELIRLLVDEEGFTFEEAYNVASKTFAYTNHTILAEALEKWDVDLIEELFPRILEIIEKIDAEFIVSLEEKGYSEEEIEDFRIVNDGKVRMANLAIHVGFAVNGVAKLHTDILKNIELKNWYELYPEKFQNKTNGITPRRWLRLCNQELSALITELLGSEDWVKNLDLLKGLEKYKDDEEVLKKFMDIKHTKKEQLAAYIKEHEGVQLDPDSIFDIQIKRLHEYKRQQMNALYVIHKYLEIKKGNIPSTPITVIFGAKAAPAYTIAKDIIHLILCLQQLINNDDEVNKYLKVVMVENYNVTYAEKLIPACDISEQISLASKEASGTGNMKFMLNGALTLGTEDGANVEIHQLVGDDNIFIFGKDSETVIKHYESEDYESVDIYARNPKIKEVVDFIISKELMSIGNPENLIRLFKEIVKKDWFMALLDLEDYTKTKEEAFKEYEDRQNWAKKMLINISKAGYFSSDRTIEEYNRDIWKLQ